MLDLAKHQIIIQGENRSRRNQLKKGKTDLERESFICVEISHLDAMLEAVKFPAGISDLNTGLADVDRDALSHFRCLKRKRQRKKMKRGRRSKYKDKKAFMKTPPGLEVIWLR